jgi:flagellar biosynthesis/type III secretory pathway protein FliH
MCKAIQEMYDDGVRDGIKQGIQKGVEQGREELLKVKYTL